jgi:outer membrane immunogenic protein
MRKVLLGAVAIVTLTVVAPASAADVPVKAPNAATTAPVYNWTGFYIGVEGGGGWADANTTVTTPSGMLFSTGDRFNTNHLAGGFGGFAVGADYQDSNWVFGVKGAYDWANISGSELTFSTNTGTNLTDGQKLNWVAMVVGRIGYAPTRNLLVYADTGAAWAGSKRAGVNVSTAGVLLATHAGSETLSGWTIGVGEEYLITRNISLLAQYNYVDFGTQGVITNVLILTGPISVNAVGRDLSTTLHMFKAGLNWRF